MYKCLCDKIFFMTDNIVKSQDAAPKKTASKSKNEETKYEDNISEEIVAEKPKKTPVPKKKVSVASDGKKFVYFESGTAYVTKSGFRFTTDNRIYELNNDEADHLLSLENFRLPTQLELEDHYKENN